MIRSLVFILLVASLSFASIVFAGENAPQSPASRLSSLVRENLSAKIADAEIRVPAYDKMFTKAPMSQFAQIDNVRLVSDMASGMAQFEVIGTDVDQHDLVQTIQTPYEAWRKVPVALHRIYPNTKLTNEDFKLADVNVAKSPARDYRGVMLGSKTDFSGQQTTQSILEGQYVVTTAITKTPDLRKGDTVKLELNSGELSLTTQAVVEEPASVGNQVRVMTVKTKRELLGLVKNDHSVEVNL